MIAQSLRSHSPVTAEFPARCRGRVQHQHTKLALNARAQAVAVQRVRAGGVRTRVAPRALLHLPEGRVVVAVRAQRERLPSHTRRP